MFENPLSIHSEGAWIHVSWPNLMKIGHQLTKNLAARDLSDTSNFVPTGPIAPKIF